jgi:K+/H+ antiporter YhaU regulatory subunit KhtT
MGMVATILPLVIEAFKLAPQLIDGGRTVIDSAKKIWETVTAEEEPTPEQRRQYDEAEAAAFAALMQSTADVAEEDDQA